jgi:hypothetical protein
MNQIEKALLVKQKHNNAIAAMQSAHKATQEECDKVRFEYGNEIIIQLNSNTGFLYLGGTRCSIADLEMLKEHLDNIL